MKTNQRPLIHATAVAGLLLSALTLHAQIYQLLIDDSNPASVVFSASGANSSADASNGSAQGIVLANFFTAIQSIGYTVSAPTLVVPGSDFLQTATSFNFGGTQVDLNLSNSGPSPAGENFSTSSVAFLGSVTLDMTVSAAALPSPGAFGSIVAFNFGTNPTVGEWTVVAVPEPESCAIAGGLALIGFALWRRRTT
jgi:hypothetical protein